MSITAAFLLMQSTPGELPPLFAPQAAAVLPTQYFDRWALEEKRFESPGPIGPLAVGREAGQAELTFTAGDGRLMWKVRASSLGFGTSILIRSPRGMRLAVGAGPDNFPRIGFEGRFLKSMAANIKYVSSLSANERNHYRSELLMSRKSFAKALAKMRADSQSLFGGVDRAPPCFPPSCVY